MRELFFSYLRFSTSFTKSCGCVCFSDRRNFTPAESFRKAEGEGFGKKVAAAVRAIRYPFTTIQWLKNVTCTAVLYFV